MRLNLFVSVLILSTVVGCGSSKKDDAAASDCFTANVKPIVDTKCSKCHTTDHKTKWYESKEKFLASTAKANVAGTGTVMPPATETQLTAAEKQIFADCK